MALYMEELAALAFYPLTDVQAEGHIDGRTNGADYNLPDFKENQKKTWA